MQVKIKNNISDFTPNKLYNVYGIQFYDGHISVLVEDDICAESEYVRGARLEWFDVVSSHIPKIWIQQLGNLVTAHPLCFTTDFFFDKLSDGDGEVLKSWRIAKQETDAEIGRDIKDRLR